MRRTVILVVLALLGLGAPSVWAQRLDAASAEALAAVMQMLQDPSQRAAAIAGSRQGIEADQKVSSLTGSDRWSEELYQLAAEIFSDLTQNLGGDVGKISAALQQGQANPAAFAAMLSPATLARLHDLAAKISDQRR